MNDNSYNPSEFLSKFRERVKAMPRCPFCGKSNYSVNQEFAQILVQGRISGIQIGTSIPAGVISCDNCGHIEFFALGAYDMLPKHEVEKNEQ